MAKNVQHVSHIKSKQIINGKPKLPDSSLLVEGEIAINFAEGVETISTKNESGNVVTFSSDNYYTEQKLGSGFTDENSGRTVTEALDEKVNVADVISAITPSNSGSTNPIATSIVAENEKVVSEALINLHESIEDLSGQSETVAAALVELNEKKLSFQEFRDYSSSTKSDIDDLSKVIATSIITTSDARGYGEISPTLAEYTGNKDSLYSILSHFKLGWFDENGNLNYECSPGRISASRNGSSIAIDGTNGDLMVYVDSDIYVDRATVEGLSVYNSTATTHNVIGFGLIPHMIGNKPSKKFEPFAFTPHCAKYKNVEDKTVGYSYYDGGRVQTSINNLASSICALNKGGGYMGLYYEFYEIWLMAMYLELGTLDFTRQDLFGNGCTQGTPNASNWFADDVVGNSGGLSGETYVSFYTAVASYNFAEMLEAQRIMDGIIKSGFADQIGGTVLYTYDENGDVIEAPSTVNVFSASTMETDKKYFTVRNVNGCQGLADGVMTGVVNIYHNNTSKGCIIKYSHPIYRGLDLLSGFYTQLEGLHYVVKHTGTTASLAQSQELFYTESWREVPTDVNIYTSSNSIVTAETETGLDDNPVLVSNYHSGGQFPTGSDGWGTETNYNISLFAHKAVGGSQHSYECGHIWYRGTSYNSPAGTDSNGYLLSNAKSANASVVGCAAHSSHAGRTLVANVSVVRSLGNYAGGFAHPQIKV